GGGRGATRGNGHSERSERIVKVGGLGVMGIARPARSLQGSTPHVTPGGRIACEVKSPDPPRRTRGGLNRKPRKRNGVLPWPRNLSHFSRRGTRRSGRRRSSRPPGSTT